MAFSKSETKALATMARGSHKCTPEQREAAVREYIGGATLKTLAAKYGVTISSVHGWVTRARFRAQGSKR